MANDLRVGAKNEAVKKVQERLLQLGHLSYGVTTADGVFGPLTFAAVRAFQGEHPSLVVDGIVGMKTIDKLFPELVPQYVPPKRHKILDLTLLQVLARANGSIGAPIKYHLEYPNGGTDPDSNMPADESTGFLDCSGFTAWCLGYDRDFATGMSKTLDKWDGYANTDSKIAEATAEGFLWSSVKEPAPGDLIVGESFRKPLALRRTIGHEGVIVAVDKYRTRGLAGVAVVHCSPSNYKHSDSAVFKTSASLWAGYKNLKFLRFNRGPAISLLDVLRGKLES